MICKECGAYNPDHATYCKVCAASLKSEPEAVNTPAEPEEEQQPTKRFSRPSWVMSENTEAVQQDAHLGSGSEGADHSAFDRCRAAAVDFAAELHPDCDFVDGEAV